VARLRIAPASIAALVLLAPASLMAQGAATTAATVPVTIDNFVRADTDHYFKKRVDAGALGQFVHDREPIPIDKQPVIRMNRDTPYSVAVFDLTTPVTIVKPDTKGRFQSLLVINEDHYLQRVIYEPGTYTFTQKEMGTRYIQMNARTFVNPNDPKDLAELHKAQDGLKVTQASRGSFEVPNWDQAQLDGLRKAILTMTPYVPDSKYMFGKKDEVHEVRHLLGTAGGFGGNREEDAIYLSIVPELNDGKTQHVLTVKDVPVDGFWSVIVYNKDGYFEAPAETISVNNVTVKPNADGTATIHFGGEPKASNYLRIMPGWSYMVRLYQPRKEILDGSWKFPEAQPIH